MSEADVIVKIGIAVVVSAAGLWYTWENYISPWWMQNQDDDDDEWGCGITAIREEEVIDKDAIPMKILYGTQTGTAEGFALELRKQAKKYGFSGVIGDIEDFEFEELVEEPLVIFVVATYGEGEPTDGSEEFYSLMKEKAEAGEKVLESTSFAVFGLGNRQYEFFNQMGKDYDKFLGEIGGERLLDVGLGDDDQNLESEWLEWKTQFWDIVLPKYKGPDFVIDDTSFECSYTTVWIPDDTKRRLPKPQRVQCTTRNGLESSRIVKVKDVRQLRQNLKEGSTLHVDFDLGKLNIRYRTADNLNVIAPNDTEEVLEIIERLGLQPEDLFELKRVDVHDITPLPLPSCISVKNAFRWQLDIHAPPRKRFLREILSFCSDEGEKKELEELGDTMDDRKGEFWTLLKVLNKFPSLDPPLEALCELLPKLRPRAYTISSSNRVDPRTVSIAIKLDFHEAEDNTTFEGVASKYISKFVPGEDCRVFVTPSSFRLPRNMETAVLMIGPGTGLAPFRAIIQEGNEIIKKGKKIPGKWHLYFGCRYRDSDFIYKDELEKARDDPESCLDALHIAFSRETPKKIYVQDLLRQNGDEVYRLVNEQKAKIMVCGATAMGKAVREALQTILCLSGGMTPEVAKATQDKWLGTGRYVQELWG